MSLIGVFFAFRFFRQPVNAQYVVKRDDAFHTSDIIRLTTGSSFRPLIPIR